MAEWAGEQAGSKLEWVMDARPIDRASELLSTALFDSLELDARVRLAIPGGSALEAVPGARARLGDAWGRVNLTWVDERCVPVTDPESNRGAAVRKGLVSAAGRRSDPPGHGYQLPLFEDGETPLQALQRVTTDLNRIFRNALDVVLLGMGVDGHVASLFPSRVMPVQGLVAHVPDSPKPPRSRITLTHAALATAKRVILVATGEAKRDALERLLSGDVRLPAWGLDGLVIVTDLDLAMCMDLEADRKGV